EDSVNDPTDASGPLDIASAKLVQKHRSLVFQLGTRGHWNPGSLDRLPTFGDPEERFACLFIRRVAKERAAKLCFGRPGTGRQSVLGLSVVKHGSPSQTLIPARVEAVENGRFKATFRPGRAGLDPGRYRWRAATQWSGAECQPDASLSCEDQAPNGREARHRLLPVQPVRCRDTSRSPVLHGPRGRKTVALTFDDGPSDYTPEILSVLRRYNASGTFFQVGDQVVGREPLAQDLLASGQELANHSLRHEYKPSYSSMATTSHRIKAATGFRPCVFRPPYGAYDSRVVGDARSLGMTTVNWDVDPMDWTTPGSDVIYQRVVSNVQPGSIVLMHDGGGNRSQTVAALPRIIQNLKGRGYHFSTVSQMLGQRTIWEPVSRKALKRRRTISRDTLPMRQAHFEPPKRFSVADNKRGLGRE
ncbi:MAG: polysaccharide deacetylase family protein, partial [Rubrobacteraceae bacterium]